MKKGFSIFSLIVLLFSTFLSTFVYADNEDDAVSEAGNNQESDVVNYNTTVSDISEKSYAEDVSAAEDVNMESKATIDSANLYLSYTDPKNNEEVEPNSEKKEEKVTTDSTESIETDEMITTEETQGVEEPIVPSKVPNGPTVQGDSEECFKFVIDNGVLKEINYNGSAGCSQNRVVIPSTVTEIGDWAWFADLDDYNVTELVIPDSVKIIGNGAFYHLSGSVSITLGTGVTFIGEQAFKGSDAVGKTFKGNINLKGLTEIGTGAFKNATINDLNIELANNATLWQQSFEGASINNVNITNASKIGYLSFQKANISNELNIVGDDNGVIIDNLAFEYANINKIKLSNVQKIIKLAFHYVNRVSDLTLTGINEGAIIEQQAFQGVLFVERSDISLYNVRYINKQAFDKERNQQSNYINNLTILGTGSDSIVGYLSFHALSIRNINITNMQKIGELSFKNLGNIESIIITGVNNGTLIDKNAFQSFTTSGGTDIRLYNVTDIYSGAFYNYNQPQQIKKLDILFTGEHGFIDQQAFGNAIINNISIDNVEKIGWLAFQYVQEIEILNITGTTNGFEIEKNAFESSSIQNISLNNVKRIGKWAFLNMFQRNYSNQPKIDYLKIIGNENGLEIGESAFQQNGPYYTIEKIQIENVTEIGKTAFQKAGINYLIIKGHENGVKIGESAFQQSGPVNAINNIEIENVTQIGKYAFQNAKNIDNLKIKGHENGVRILESAFQHQDGSSDSIGNIDIRNVKEIQKYAFHNTKNINSLNIVGVNGGAILSGMLFQNSDINSEVNLENIKYIGEWAFLDSTLTGLTLLGSKNGCIIDTGAFKNTSRLEYVLLGTGVTNIGDLAFFTDTGVNNDRVGPLKTVIISGSDMGTIIKDKAFSNNSIENLILGNNITVGNEVFVRNSKANNLEVYLGTKDVIFGNFALTYELDDPVVFITDIEVSEFEPRSDEFYNAGINLIQGRRINFMNDGNVVSSEVSRVAVPYKTPISVIKAGYELMGWSDGNSEGIFDFNGALVNENKTFNAKWKSLEDKANESTSNVSYLSNTTMTVNEKEIVLSENQNIDLVAVLDNSEKSQKEIKVQAELNKEVEYEGGVEVFVELTINQSKEKIDGTAKFSVPIAVKIPVSSSNDMVKVKVKHKGEDFGYKGLTKNPAAECDDGAVVSDQYRGEDIEVTKINGESYARIYTCSASTFVAYTEKNKVYPSRGVGRPIMPKNTKIEENEHNSAETQKSKTTIKLSKELQERTLTRGEVAVMVNILLDVFPQLVEGKQNIDDVINACSNYADAQKFTRQEKKAITRLCKLSIMGIDTNNKPLDQFMVKELLKNKEFALIIDKSISIYNERDFGDIKSALKKLEGNEENLVFGTLFDLFMSIKDVLK